MDSQEDTPAAPGTGDDVLSVSPDEASGDNAEVEVKEDETEEVEKVNSNIIRYSKDFIMHLKNAPLSRQRPVVTDKSPNCFKWLDKKRSDTSLDEDKNGLAEKRRPGDPRERLRKESEGIILSPQRKSFISGCHIASGNGTVSTGNRDVLDNPIFLQGSDPVTSKTDIGGRGLRAGSARISSRDANPWERGGDGDPDYIYRPPGASRERDDRYERRSFGRDLYDKNHRSDRDSDGRFSDRKDSYRDDSKRGGRFDRRRTSEKEEPEWFSSGPTSQHDTIELRGFDDPIPSPPPTKGNAIDTNGNNANSSESSGNVKSRPNRRTAGSGRTPSAVAASQAKEQPPITDENDKENTIKEVDSMDERSHEKLMSDNNAMNNIDSNAPDFLDAFFKMDNIPGLLTNGEVDENLSEGSRFSRWFRRDSPPVNNQSAQDANIKDSLFPDILKDPSITVFTSEPHHVFAPISPAENTNSSSTPAPNALLEMLCRVQKSNDHMHVPQQQLLHLKNSENIPGKMHNLEELEARMRSMPVPSQQHVQQIHPHGPPRQPAHHNFQPQPDDEFSKFLRLMTQPSGGFSMPASNNIPTPKQHMQQQQPQHANILQMLNKSQKPDHHVENPQAMQNHQVPVSHDLLCRLLQVQNQDTNKMMHHSGRHYQVSPIPTDTQGYINNLQPSRDLLQRPEAQAIIQGLRQGEITVQHLMQQLSNPGLQSRHKELLGSIIKFSQQQVMQSAPSPRNRLIIPPPQQLRISPLPPNAYCVSPIMATSPNTLAVHPAIPQRIPSPRELQAHTQSIMQGALIKKKLEEQRENFRRRQEQAGPQTPAVPHPNTPSSSSPNKHQNNALGFTPTSVLRKMTAEKDCDPTVTSGAKAAGWGAPPNHLNQAVAPKQGRPIVKGSSSSVGLPYQQMSADFPSQYSNPSHQQTQQLFNNLQQGPPPQGRAIRPAGASSNNTTSHSSQSHGGNLVMSLQRQPQQQHQHQQMYHPQHFQGHNRSQISGSNPLQFMMQQKNEHGRNMAPALSPTSNQLARWFSPELLAQANAGKLPSVNMAQNVLSLEELERKQHSEATVHN